jgi:predicted nucleotidyltransferase component of viral defense system
MINPKCFSKEWIEGFRSKPEYAALNPAVFEKMIFALHLVELLAASRLDFIFKGGTSLTLLLSDFNRFSVDIDIITTLTRKDVESALDFITKEGRLSKWTLDHKRSYQPGIPKAHYELSFNSNFNFTSSQILLDVVFQKNLYPKLLKVSISSAWVETDGQVEVMIPSTESILGDKLTAFAPTTTGIRYNSGKSLDMVKQLFDVGVLFDRADDINIIRQSFEAFYQQELIYRELDLSVGDILSDILDTARIIALRERNKLEPFRSRFTEWQKGIKAMDSFLTRGRFNIEHAVIAASKAALLSVLIEHKNLNAIPKYDQNNTLSGEITDLTWNFLNRLRKFPDKSAFFYWQKTVELLTNIDN